MVARLRELQALRVFVDVHVSLSLCLTKVSSDVEGPKVNSTSDTHRHEIARKFTAVIPHSLALGMSIEDLGDGEAVMKIPYDERFIGDPETGVLHGGVITALLDSCCGTAVISHPATKGPTATLDLRIDYMRAARPGEAVLAFAQCYRQTRSVAFVRAVAYETDRDDPIATATGAFTVAPAPEPKS